VDTRILIVDDEPSIRELLSRYFRKHGIEVTTAPTGEKARQLVREGKFDLAILDFQLAGENGLDLLCQFRTDYPRLPVILFTGFGDGALPAQALASGASAFLSKTESLHAVLAEVRRYLPSAQQSPHPLQCMAPELASQA
jgi:DNA-binding response OmpR family regulator